VPEVFVWIVCKQCVKRCGIIRQLYRPHTAVVAAACLSWFRTG
ncbi:MAG: hypothetical protein ACI9HX_000909, partial [Pseudoalteromonas tetraodonis]